MLPKESAFAHSHIGNKCFAADEDSLRAPIALGHGLPADRVSAKHQPPMKIILFHYIKSQIEILQIITKCDNIDLKLESLYFSD